MSIRRCRLEKRTLSPFISILGSDNTGFSPIEPSKLEYSVVVSTLRSSEICIIDYFFIAPN